MKAKEFKELVNMIPDDFEIGYSKTYTVTENFNMGTHTSKHFYNDVNINMDLKNRQVSLLEIKGF